MSNDALIKEFQAIVGPENVMTAETDRHADPEADGNPDRSAHGDPRADFLTGTAGGFERCIRRGGHPACRAGRVF